MIVSAILLNFSHSLMLTSCDASDSNTRLGISRLQTKQCALRIASLFSTSSCSDITNTLTNNSHLYVVRCLIQHPLTSAGDFAL